jgi:1,4-dihydroxy-2-naphthoate polyprenyltransferase
VRYGVSVRAAAATLPRITQQQWRDARWLSRWLIISRAPLLALSLASAAAGGALALLHGALDAKAWLLCTIGLTLAHAAANQFNDLIDARRGIDQGDYFRLRYGTHAIEHGLWRPAQLGTSSALTGAAALGIGLYLCQRVGTSVGWPLALGALLLLGYTHPLKRWGLGEPTVLLVWGPLMIGGTFLVTTGSWDWWVAGIGAAFALGPTTVVFGKHIDKLVFDRQRNVRTLPVRLGEARARRWVQVLLLLQYATVAALILVQRLPWPVLLVSVALPQARRLWRIYQTDAPPHRPADYPAAIWPLWYAAFAFVHARRFGALFVTGLLLGWAVRFLPAG